MKLKFRAETKDWVMFGIYAVLLLYFVAIAVLNLAQFASGDIDKPFHGFNPFPAFTPRFLAVTLVLYVVALVASVLSVSDRFFDTEKGFGISIGSKKADKGYSRWLDDNELKREKDIEMVRIQDEDAEAGGIPLINDGKRMWVDNGEGHNIIIGSTGAGKTVITMFPLIKSLAKHNESMIVTDPKGELYEGTSEMLKKRGYNVVVLNFRDPQRGSGWNPLHLPYQYYKRGNHDKANELVDDLALNILYSPEAQNQDPFWEKTSADYFSGICLGLFEDAKEEEINLNSVNVFTTVGEEKSRPNSVYVNDYFNTKDPTSPAYVSASSTIIAPTDTKGSILSVFKQKLRLFAARENISEMLSHSDFEFEDIGSKKTAVFIVIQDEKKTYHPLVTIFVKQCYEALVDYAQKCGGKLPYRTNFLLDEFANMPKLNDVETMVSAARSRKMRFFFVIQNFAQLAEVYGKNIADTIRGNCTNIIYLISTELAALEEISKMCGEVKIKTGKGDKEKEETRPLITVSDLQKLKFGEVILLRSRLDPFKTKVIPDFKIEWGPLYTTAPRGNDEVYPVREKEPVHVFDLKGFVQKKNEEKVNEIISKNMGKGVPAMPGMGVMPTIPGLGNIPGMGGAGKKPPIDLEAFAKRIDARIAELEAEEKAEQERLLQAKTRKKGLAAKAEEAASKIDAKEKVKEEPKPISKTETAKKPESVKKEVKAKPKQAHEIKQKSADFASKVSSKVNKKAEEKQTADYVTDDQFFDDFFSDDI